MKKPVILLSLLFVGSLVSCGGGSSIAASSEAASSAAGSSAAASSEEVSSEEVSSEEATSSSSSARAVAAAGDESGTHLTMWISKADLAGLTDLVNGFNAAYPTEKIYVNATEMAEGDVGDKYTADPDNVPDIAHVPGDVVNKLVNNSSIASYPATTLETYLKGEISDTVLKAGQDDNGVQYALPFSLNTYFMYYDTSVYTADDIETLTDMKATCKTNAPTKKALAFPMNNGWYTQSVFMSNPDGGIFKDHGRSSTETYMLDDANFNTAKAIRSMYADGSYFLDKDNDLTAAITGKTVAAFVSGSWDYEQAVKGFGEGNVGMASLPEIDINGVSTKLKSIGDYKSIVVSNSSKNKAAAQKFAAYLGTNEGQKTRWTDNDHSTVPTASGLATDEEYKANNKFADVVADVLDYTFAQNTSPKFGNWWNAADSFATAIKGKPNCSDTELKGFLTSLNTSLLA